MNRRTFGSEFLSASEAPLLAGDHNPSKWMDWRTGIIYYGDEPIETV